MTKRLFIGIPVSSAKAVQRVESWRNSSRMRLNKMSWVKPENWHLTLYFLGDTPGEKVDLLKQLIDQSLGSTLLFWLIWKSLAYFPIGAIPVCFGWV